MSHVAAPPWCLAVINLLVFDHEPSQPPLWRLVQLFGIWQPADIASGSAYVSLACCDPVACFLHPDIIPYIVPSTEPEISPFFCPYILLPFPKLWRCHNSQDLSLFCLVRKLELCAALCPWWYFFFFLMKTANNVFVFFHLQQNHNGSWQAIVPSWHGAAAHCADRSLMWDYIERCVPAGTFRGQEDFEIQWMWLQFFCQNWIRAQAAYFYLNLMLSRVQRQLLHLQQIVRKGKKKERKLSALPWLCLKPFGSTASAWSINWAAWEETSEKLQGWLVRYFRTWKCERHIYRSASDITTSGKNASAPTKQFPIKSQKSGRRMEERNYVPVKRLLVLIHSST